MEYKPGIETVLERYRAFWRKDVYDRPPIRIRFPVPGEGGEEWTRACQNPVSYYAYWDNIMSCRTALADDDVPTATLDLGPAFMAGVMGCDVRFGYGSSWSEHPLEDWSDLAKLREHPIDDRNPWIVRLKEMIAYFTEQGEGKLAVGLANMMGPGDIMAALRGPTQLCIDFYTYPEEVKQLAQICTDAWIKVAKLQFDLIEPLEGGYCDNYDIWTPGRSCYFADDISALLSPETYREHLFAFDCQVAASLDNPWMHVHSGGVRLAPELIKIPGLMGIQVVNDYPAGPSLQEIVPLLKMIQKDHCLLLRKYPMEELRHILPQLSPEGLYIDTQCASLEEAQEILGWWETQAIW